MDNNEGQPKEKRKVEFRQSRIFQLWDELEQQIKVRKGGVVFDYSIYEAI